MLLGHLGDTHICTDDEQAIVREQRCQTVHSRLQVLLVTTHVQQVNNLSRVGHDFWPNLVLLSVVVLLGHILLAIGIETHNFVSNRARSTVLLLVGEVEHSASDGATTIVLRTWCGCQYTRQGRLTSINITKHCYPNVDQMVSVYIIFIYNLRGLSIGTNVYLWVLAVATWYSIRFLNYLIVNSLSVDISIWNVVCLLGWY